MRNQKVKFVRYIYLSIILIAINSSVVLPVPLANFNGDAKQRLTAYTIGLVFWISGAAAYLFLLQANKTRKSLIKSQAVNKFTKSRPGLISFFKTFPGMIAYCSLAVSVIAFIIVNAVPVENKWSFTFITALLLFSVQMHCVLNGENYRYKKYIEKRKRHG